MSMSTALKPTKKKTKRANRINLPAISKSETKKKAKVRPEDQPTLTYTYASMEPALPPLQPNNLTNKDKPHPTSTRESPSRPKIEAQFKPEIHKPLCSKPHLFIHMFLPKLFLTKNGESDPHCYKISGEGSKQAGRKIRTNCQCLHNFYNYFKKEPDCALDQIFHEIVWLANKFNNLYHHKKEGGITEMIQLSQLIYYKNETFGKPAGKGGKPKFVFRFLDDMLLHAQLIAMTNSRCNVPEIFNAFPEFAGKEPMPEDKGLTPLCPNALQMLFGYSTEFRERYVSLYTEKISSSLQDKMKNHAVARLIYHTFNFFSERYLADSCNHPTVILKEAKRLYYSTPDVLHCISHKELLRRFPTVFSFMHDHTIISHPLRSHSPSCQPSCYKKLPQNKEPKKVILDIAGKEAFSYPGEHPYFPNIVAHPINGFSFFLNPDIKECKITFIDSVLMYAINYSNGPEWTKNLQYAPNMEVRNINGNCCNNSGRVSIGTFACRSPVTVLLEHYLEDSCPQKAQIARSFEKQILDILCELEREGCIPPMYRCPDTEDVPLDMAAAIHGVQWPTVHGDHAHLFRNPKKDADGNLPYCWLERPYLQVPAGKLDTWIRKKEILPLIVLLPLNESGNWIQIYEYFDRQNSSKSKDCFMYLPPGVLTILPATVMRVGNFRTDLSCSKYLELIVYVPLRHYRPVVLQKERARNPFMNWNKYFAASEEDENDPSVGSKSFKADDTMTHNSHIFRFSQMRKFCELFHIFSE